MTLVIAMATDEAELNICEQITRIDHAITETDKDVAEQPELEARKDFRPPPVAARRHRDNRMTRFVLQRRCFLRNC